MKSFTFQDVLQMFRGTLATTEEKKPDVYDLYDHKGTYCYTLYRKCNVETKFPHQVFALEIAYQKEERDELVLHVYLEHKEKWYHTIATFDKRNLERAFYVYEIDQYDEDQWVDENEHDVQWVKPLLWTYFEEHPACRLHFVTGHVTESELI